jgi:hypothetical protein
MSRATSFHRPIDLVAKNSLGYRIANRRLRARPFRSVAITMLLALAIAPLSVGAVGPTVGTAPASSAPAASAATAGNLSALTTGSPLRTSPARQKQISAIKNAPKASALATGVTKATPNAPVKDMPKAPPTTSATAKTPLGVASAGSNAASDAPTHVHFVFPTPTSTYVAFEYYGGSATSFDLWQWTGQWNFLLNFGTSYRSVNVYNASYGQWLALEICANTTGGYLCFTDDNGYADFGMYLPSQGPQNLASSTSYPVSRDEGVVSWSYDNPGAYHASWANYSDTAITAFHLYYFVQGGWQSLGYWPQDERDTGFSGLDPTFFGGFGSPGSYYFFACPVVWTIGENCTNSGSSVLSVSASSPHIQAAAPWQTQIYQGSGWANCGPASVSMAMRSYGEPVTLEYAAMRIRGNANPYSGGDTNPLNSATTNALLRERGLQLIQTRSLAEIHAQLSAGHPVIMLLNSGYYVRQDSTGRWLPYPYGGGWTALHIVVVTGNDVGTEYINDPLAYNTTLGQVDQPGGTTFSIRDDAFTNAATNVPGNPAWYSAAVAPL